jgi:hypothetical protein
MKRILSAIFFCLLFSQFLSAQFKYKGMALNLGYGYKTNIAVFGIGVSAGFGNNLELVGSTALQFVGGAGFTGGVKYNFIPQKRFFPSAQFSYRFLFPSKPDIGYDNDNKIVKYSVSGGSSLFPQIGFNFRTSEGNVITFNLNYLLPITKVEAVYVSGNRSPYIEKQINNKYKEGIGFSIIFSLHFSNE